MKENVGGLDKWIRMGVGAVLLIWAAIGQSWIIGIIGLVVFLTGLLNRCGVYYLFGISTAKRK